MDDTDPRAHDSGSDDTDSAPDTDDGAGPYEMDDADALFDIVAYQLGGDLSAADLTGTGAAQAFFVDNDFENEASRGYVVPGPSVMASEADDTDTDGLLMLGITRGDCWLAALSFGPIGDIDGDGYPDLAFPQPICAEGPYVASGATASIDHFPRGSISRSNADLTVLGAEEMSEEMLMRLSALGAPMVGGSLQVSGYSWDLDGGTVWLFPLPEEGSELTLDSASSTISSEDALDAVGEVDLDGDGVPELLDMTPMYDSAYKRYTQLYVFDVPVDGGVVSEDDARTTVKDAITANWGNDSYQILLPGDQDGDGLDDLVFVHPCGGPSAECSGQIAGLTGLAELGSEASLSSAARWTVAGDASYTMMGRDACLVPDVDDDGITDLFAFSYPDGSVPNAYEVFLSSSLAEGGTFSSADAARRYIGESDDTSWLVASGDLDGDGNPELLIQYSEFGEGGAYVFSW